MATKHFDCDSCGNHGKIIFKEDGQITSTDIAYCPMCGADIWEEDEYVDEDEE